MSLGPQDGNVRNRRVENDHRQFFFALFRDRGSLRADFGFVRCGSIGDDHKGCPSSFGFLVQEKGVGKGRAFPNRQVSDRHD